MQKNEVKQSPENRKEDNASCGAHHGIFYINYLKKVNAALS